MEGGIPVKSNKSKYKMPLVVYSLVLLTILTFLFQVNTAYAEIYDLDQLPSGGHTIIIDSAAYSKMYLENNKVILTNALNQGKTVYIKLDNGIFIDQTGVLISDITKIPQITKYFTDNTEMEFMVLSIY